MDQASFLILRARDQPQLLEAVWVYERGLDLDGLMRLYRNIDGGLLGRQIERSPLPFGRHRWVSAHAPAEFEVADARPRAQLSDWVDERAQLPIDPETGPGWHFAVLPMTDGSAAVCVVASHCLIDGGGALVTAFEAVHGVNRDFDYPPPRSRTRTRALLADARETVRGLPEVARTLAAAVKAARARRGDIARLGPARPPITLENVEFHADGGVVIPSITIRVDREAWDLRAKVLGGNSNSLVTGFAARLGERMGRANDDGVVRVILMANDRNLGDSCANAVSFTDVNVDAAQVTTDLTAVRADTRQALKTMRETPDEALTLLPLVPFLPKRAVRGLADVLFAFPDLPVTCSNIGDIDPAVSRLDGTEADYLFMKGVDQKVSPHILEQKFLVVSGRIGGEIFLTVTAYHLGEKNSKTALREHATQVLTEFDLNGVID